MFHMSVILPMIGVLDGRRRVRDDGALRAGAALRRSTSERATFMFPTFPTDHPGAAQPSRLPTRDLSPRCASSNNVAPPDTLRAMQAACRTPIQVSAYGLTECGGVVAVQRPRRHARAADAPRAATPSPGSRSIVDLETGSRCPAGERARRDRGARLRLFDGYHKDPERTAEAVDAAAGSTRATSARSTTSGRITYLGGSKDMLKVGGENVAALEIESYLATHPAVKIAQVVGVPDAKSLEVPAAFVELGRAPSVTEEELIEYCRGRSRASRSRATCASSTSGRCRRRRSRSSGSARSCWPRASDARKVRA